MPYIDMAANDKARYQKEMQEHTAKKAAAIHAQNRDKKQAPLSSAAAAQEIGIQNINGTYFSWWKFDLEFEEP